MSKLARITQQIFGSTATDVGVFGSAQAGTPTLSKVLVTLMGTAAWAGGWLQSVMGDSKFPPLEEMNGIDYVVTSQLAYLFQQGVPEYDVGTTYYASSIVCETGTYRLYGSVTNSNIGNPLTDPSNWLFLGDLSSIAGIASLGNIAPLNTDSTNFAVSGSHLAFGSAPTLPSATTATTQSVGDSTAKIATTQFVNPDSSISSTGHRQNADGTIEQWGNVAFTSGTQSVSFPKVFPTACYWADYNTSVETGDRATTAQSTTGATFSCGGSAGGTLYWRAFGK